LWIVFSWFFDTPDHGISVCALLVGVSDKLSNVSMSEAPLWRDRAVQCIYWVAYRLHLLWTFVFRPATEGVWVAVWCQGQLLLIKNSYRRFITLPGGGMDGGETPLAAALRELREEVGIETSPQNLFLFKRYLSQCEYKHDRINLFELELVERPVVRIDNREVSWAQVATVEDALGMKLFPTLRCYLEDKLAEGVG
jgi:8-oxo-dGTP pyrophosphatase MutT (NUDIX family)